MKLSLALLASAVGYSAANPFAPKVTRNTKQARRNSKLMAKAKPLRRLDQQEEEEVDLSTYSIKFEKCQFVKQYPAEEGGGGDQEGGSILQTQRFVIFRLCPNQSCSSCNYNYGEYIVDMETYLESAIEYKQQVQEDYCDTCNQCYERAAEAAEQDDDNQEEDDEAWKCYNMDTDTCYAQCQNIENMEENGYMDASEFIGCEKIDVQNDDDGEAEEIYAGAVCASSGTRIKIGIFKDEECSEYDDSKSIEDYMVDGDGYNLKLSYHLLKQTFAEDECIANCLVEEEQNPNEQNDDGNQEEEEAEINEMCEELYEAAGKCEGDHGFENGIVDYDNYQNQMRNEELVCEFITTIKAGHYDMTGEIVVSGGRSTIKGMSNTTGGQKFALTFFALGSLGLAGYAAMLHQQLTKGAKADLAQQGGALA